MTSKIRASSIRGKVDFGIITVREDEFEAVLKRFPTQQQAEGRRLYSVSWFGTSDGDEYLVAVVRCPEQGTGEGQHVAQDMIADLKPQWIVLVGIAGGVPDDDYTLGDVVAAMRLHDFSLEAVLEQGKSEYGVAGGPMHRDVQTLLAHLPAMKSALRGWEDETLIGLPTPKVNYKADNFYGSDAWIAKTKQSLKRHFTNSGQMNRRPKVITGSVASSDKLVKDNRTISAWKRAARQTRIVEMELAGVYRAARQKHREYPILAIRGISDIVGFKRDPAWTAFACETAASFIAALLKTKPVPPRIQQGKSNKDKAPVDVQKPRPSTNLSILVRGTAEAASLMSSERLYSNLLKVVEYQSEIHIANSLCADEREISMTLKSLGDYPGSEWIEKSGVIYSFHDLREHPWDKVCDSESTETHGTSHWASSNDPVEQRYFVELLNRCLVERARRLNLLFNRQDEYYYFVATGDLKPRRLAYPGILRDSSREVFGGYPRTKEGDYDYYRHSAFKGQFVRYGTEWFLEITPTYHFTHDGHRLHRGHQALLKGIKKLEKHQAVRGQVIMWAAYLQGTCNVKPVEYPFLKFGPLIAFDVGFGFDDQEWLKKEENTDEGETLDS